MLFRSPVASAQGMDSLPHFHRCLSAVQHQNAEPGVEQLLHPAGVHRSAPGIEVQAAAGYSLVLRLFGAFGLDHNGPDPFFLGGELRQQPCPQARSPVARQDRKIVQLADHAARRADHHQVGRQLLPAEHAPGVAEAGGLMLKPQRA